VKGLSTRDIEAALTDTLAVEGVSKSTVSTLCGQLKKDFEQWQNRDLTAHKILYLFCDGIYLRLRPEDEKAVAVLCAYGIREDGKKVLLHLAVGDKESTVCWKSFFQDLKQRGLVEPLLVILDGNSGLRKAVRDCFPGSWVQRCQVHRMRNILCKLPEKARPGIKKLLQKAFTAQSHKAGLMPGHRSGGSLDRAAFSGKPSEAHPNDEFIGALIWRRPSAVQSRAPVHE
jgi:transposase-like protein